MTRFYLKVQMKSLKNFKCGWIVNNVDINKGKNSHFFGETTIKASPPIYVPFMIEKLEIHLNFFY